jgi:hypothetical protein
MLLSPRLAVYLSRILALFLTFGEEGLLAVKNRVLDEIRKQVGRRSEERRGIPRAGGILDFHGVQDFHAYQVQMSPRHPSAS